jgi:hypothetical protein
MSTQLYEYAVEKGVFADARQRPGILLPEFLPSAPFPWENITTLLAEPISLLEKNFDVIKAEVLSAVNVWLLVVLSLSDPCSLSPSRQSTLSFARTRRT